MTNKERAFEMLTCRKTRQAWSADEYSEKGKTNERRNC